MEKIKVAIIGCGNIANSAHIPAYMANPKAEIVCFCDIIRKSQGGGGKIRSGQSGYGLPRAAERQGN